MSWANSVVEVAPGDCQGCLFQRDDLCLYEEAQGNRRALLADTGEAIRPVDFTCPLVGYGVLVRLRR